MRQSCLSSCLSWEGGFETRVLTDRVLTGDTRLARAELREEVEEGTGCGRLVIKIETRSTHTRSAVLLPSICVIDGLKNCGFGEP